ncbi:hypothetical protein QYF36_017732 [Acer negundo]|nr:hypothetical protein QYF36_017732 [Acer negundo]
MINNICHILALPYPARGHINPMMNLCKLLASKRPDLLITFVTEETYTSSGAGNFPPNIRFSYIPNGIIPSEESHAKDVFAFGLAVMSKLGAPFEQILDGLQTPAVTLILTDFFLSFAIHAGSRRNIPVAALWISTVTEFSMQCHLNLFKEKQFPTDLEEHENDVVDFVPGISPVRVSNLPRLFLENGQSIALDVWNLELPISKIQYLVSPSVYELESQVFDFLRSKFDFPIHPCGPLIPHFEINNDNPTSTPDYIEWLNSQPRSSVLDFEVYVD